MAERKVRLDSIYLYPLVRSVGADELLAEDDTDETAIILTEDGDDLEGENL